MICPFCESQIEDGLTLCPHCNAKIQQIPEAPETELTREEAPETAEASEAREIPEAPEATEARDAAPVLPEPLWNPEPEAEAAAPEASLPQPEPPQEAVPVAERKRSPKRGLLIGLGCAALAAVVGLGIWFLGRRSSPAAKLAKAAENSLHALEDYAHQLPNLGTMLDNLKAVEAGQTVHEELRLGETILYRGQEMDGVLFQGSLDGDKAAGLVGGQLALTGPGLETSLQFYADKTQLQLGSESLLEDQVLAIPFENLPQRWNESAMGKLSGLTMPEGKTIFQADSMEDLQQAMIQRYGQDWTVFRESLRVAEYEGTPHFAEGVSYTLLWDQKALDAIHQKTAKTLEALKEIQSPDQLLQINPMELGTDMVLETFWQFSDKCRDLQLLVEKELLTGFYMAEKDGEGFLELRLQGEENPWTHCTGALRTEEDGKAFAERLDLTMAAADGELRITAKTSVQDQEGKEQESEEGPITLIYKDSDGSVRLEGVELEEEMEMKLHITPVESGAAMNLEVRIPMESYREENPVIIIQVGSQVTGTIPNPPAPLSQNPTDLLGLSEDELEALGHKIYRNLMVHPE